jgi:hypothetical protein
MPSMSMGTMLPQDGEDMVYESAGYRYDDVSAYGQQEAYDGRAYGGYESGYAEEAHYDESGHAEEEYADYGADAAEFDDSAEAYETHASADVARSRLAIMPPIGSWYKAGSVEDKERELRRTIANRDNMMVLPLHTLFKIKNLGDREWRLSDVYNQSGEHAPYSYKGTPFDDDRTIKAIFLRDVSQNSPVSIDITASLVHPSSNRETMSPITPVLSSGNDEGPSHIMLRPKESSDKEVLLWRKDGRIDVTPTVRANPGLKREDLMRGLNKHPNRAERNLRTLSRNHVLVHYVKDKIDAGLIKKDSDQNPIEWKSEEGYGVIDARRADNLVEKFIREQSTFLSLRNIWDLRMKLSRGVRSSSKMTAEEDNAELISEVPVFSHGKKSEVDTYIERIKNIPYNLHWALQIELEPKMKG